MPASKAVTANLSPAIAAAVRARQPDGRAVPEAERQSEAETSTAEGAFPNEGDSIERFTPTEDAHETLIRLGKQTDDDSAQFTTLLAKVTNRAEVTKEQAGIFLLVGDFHTVPRL